MFHKLSLNINDFSDMCSVDGRGVFRDVLFNVFFKLTQSKKGSSYRIVCIEVDGRG